MSLLKRNTAENYDEKIVYGASPLDAVAKMIDYYVVVSAFEFQLLYDVLFRAAMKNVIKLFILLVLGWIISLFSFYLDGFGIK